MASEAPPLITVNETLDLGHRPEESPQRPLYEDDITPTLENSNV